MTTLRSLWARVWAEAQNALCNKEQETTSACACVLSLETTEQCLLLLQVNCSIQSGRTISSLPTQSVMGISKVCRQSLFWTGNGPKLCQPNFADPKLKLMVSGAYIVAGAPLKRSCSRCKHIHAECRLRGCVKCQSTIGMASNGCAVLLQLELVDGGLSRFVPQKCFDSPWPMRVYLSQPVSNSAWVV